MKIQDKRFSNEEIAFAEVGVIKSDENGIFDIPNDEIADSVVKAIPSFSKIIETSEGNIRRQVSEKSAPKRGKGKQQDEEKSEPESSQADSSDGEPKNLEPKQE